MLQIASWSYFMNSRKNVAPKMDPWENAKLIGRSSEATTRGILKKVFLKILQNSHENIWALF